MLITAVPAGKLRITLKESKRSVGTGRGEIPSSDARRGIPLWLVIGLVAD